MSDMYYDYDFCYYEPEDYDHIDKAIDHSFIFSILLDRGHSWVTRIIHTLKYSQLHSLSFSEACDAAMLNNIARDHDWSWVDAQIILIQNTQFRLSLVPQLPRIDVEPF